jgi:hypothetical protein
MPDRCGNFATASYLGFARRTASPEITWSLTMSSDLKSVLTRLEALESENKLLKSQLATAPKSRINMTLSEAGYIEVYGIPGKGRFSISCTPEGFEALFGIQDEIKAFAKANASILTERQALYKAQAKPKANLRTAIG